MTSTLYYVLLAPGLLVLAVLATPPVVKFFALIREGERDMAAAKQRIAARELAAATLPAVPDNPPDPKELT
ncbi:hypothetical protein [Streptomyces sp. NPDC093970]|uniref:hypothetical protein n=1 Tax=Streptomyces sp. NPDC093970 TaxID=3155076 RepID=UPI0034185F45